MGLGEVEGVAVKGAGQSGLAVLLLELVEVGFALYDDVGGLVGVGELEDGLRGRNIVGEAADCW